MQCHNGNCLSVYCERASVCVLPPNVSRFVFENRQTKRMEKFLKLDIMIAIHRVRAIRFLFMIN